MKNSTLLLILSFLLSTSTILFGQGYMLNAMSSSASSIQNCDSTLTLSISAQNDDPMVNADIDFTLLGSNFTSSQFSTYVYWGDGTDSYHNGGVSNIGSAISFNPPLTHSYASSGSYNVVVWVTNLQNNSQILDTITFNYSCGNVNFYVYGNVDCDNDGNTDSTIANGIPVTLTNFTNSYSGVQSNGMAAFFNVTPGTYTAVVDPNWLAQNGFQTTSFVGSNVTVTPNGAITTAILNLTCDSSATGQSCLSGFLFCDADSNGYFSMGDVGINNAPLMINVNGTTITTYSNANGFYSAVLSASPNTPAVLTVNPNWLTTNGYTTNFTPYTALTSDCNQYDTINIPINCGGNNGTPTSCASVYVFCDANSNGIMDNGELPIPNAPVQFYANNQSVLAIVYTDTFGYASFCSNYFQGSTVLAQVSNYWLLQHGYSSANNWLTVLASSNPTPGYYGINCGGSGNQCADLWTTVTPWIGYYQNSTAYIQLNIGNNGPGIGYTYTVSLQFPVGVTPVTSSINLPGYSISGNTITWNLTNAGIGYNYTDIIQFQIPGGLINGANHFYTSTITATNNTIDCYTGNNTHSLLQILGNSYDPNDKLVDHTQGIDPYTQQTLTYTVRFQNTGTAPAQNIYIIDTLSSNLDLTTLEIVETSHPMQVVDMGNGVKRFEFNQIWLADSTTNEPESHGHIVYRIRENAENGIGSEIRNTAYIYFDWNDPIVTNTTYNVNSALGIEEATDNDLSVYPNPTKDLITVHSEQAITGVQLITIAGQQVLSTSPIGNECTLSLMELPKGTYLLVVTTEKETSKRLIIKQ